VKLLYWGLSLVSVVGVWYSDAIHKMFTENLAFYTMTNSNLIQVVLAVLAGIFATKASDSARELKKLMSVAEIDGLLKKADEANNNAQKQQQKYEQLSKLVKAETEKQFARSMLENHRRQLIRHWSEISAIEALLADDSETTEIDPETKKHIQSYILRTKYIEYIGRNFLQNIPFFGGLLNFMFGPLWEELYVRATLKMNASRKKPQASPETP